MEMPRLIKGRKHHDHRGSLTHINNFDMSEVKRFYIIQHPTTDIKRGWRGHRLEKRWFYLEAGEFTIKLVKIDDWVSPKQELPQHVITLNENDSAVLYVPVGYATCVQANQQHAKLLVFADSFAADAKRDDHLFPVDYFKEV